MVGVAFGCPRIRELNLRRCELITDRAILSLAHGCQNHLETLNLGGCELITGSCITAIGDMCTQMKYLNVSRCYHAHEQAIFLRRIFPFLELHLEDHCR